MPKLLKSLWRILFISLLTIFTFFLHLAAWLKIGLTPLWLCLALSAIMIVFIPWFLEEGYKQKLL